jgi:hypothetical protein
MLKYALVFCLLLGGAMFADAQTITVVRQPVVVQHNLREINRHYTFSFVHQPRVACYGTFALYQQHGFAVVGYSDLVKIQAVCTQHNFQIVRVNKVQQFVVVKLPANYTWNTITTFSRANHVQFIEPAVRVYR